VTDENDLMIINKSGITIRLEVASIELLVVQRKVVRLDKS
jgi:hypothetical protein